jgi:hypothetical protein
MIMALNLKAILKLFLDRKGIFGYYFHIKLARFYPKRNKNEFGRISIYHQMAMALLLTLSGCLINITGILSHGVLKSGFGGFFYFLKRHRETQKGNNYQLCTFMALPLY